MDHKSEFHILDYFIVNNGLPIYCMNFDPLKGISQDQTRFTLISGFLSAISSFVDSMNNIGQVEEIQMSSEINFFFQRTMFEKAEMLFIIIADKNASKEYVKTVLQTATTQFLDQYLDALMDWGGNTDIFKVFDNKFTKILEEASTLISSESKQEDPILITNQLENQNQTTQSAQLQKIPLKIGQLRINTRFNRYRILRNYQELSKGTGNYESQFISKENFPWTQKESWITQGDLNNIENNTGSIIKNVQDSHNDRDIPYSNQNALSNIHIRQIVSRKLRLNSPLKSSLSGVSLFEQIPWKETVSSNVMDQFLRDPWKKVVYNSINGKSSIRELASKLGVNPDDLYLTCENFLQSGLISFHL